MGTLIVCKLYFNKVDLKGRKGGRKLRGFTRFTEDQVPNQGPLIANTQLSPPEHIALGLPWGKFNHYTL